MSKFLYALSQFNLQEELNFIKKIFTQVCCVHRWKIVNPIGDYWSQKHNDYVYDHVCSKCGKIHPFVHSKR